MTRVLAMGETLAMQGFVLAGVDTLPADGSEALLRAWTSLPADAGIVILTASAADAIGACLRDRPDVMVVVTPP